MKFSNICHALQEYYPNSIKIRYELCWAKTQAEISEPIISAAAFYCIKRSTLCSIFSAIVTYSVVLKQFEYCVQK